MEEIKNNYYIRLDEKNRIIKTFSDFFEQPSQIDILLYTGLGSQFRASSENLANDLQQYSEVENGLPLMSEPGIYTLKYENGKIQKLSTEEIQLEMDNLPKSQPTPIEVLNAKIDYIAMMADIDLEV